MQPVCPSPAQALAIAEALLPARYPDACFAFVAGSIMRGQGTWLSDIDLVVVQASVPAAWRESFIFQGVPVEAFVHDPGTLAWFIEADIKRGRPSLLNMIAEGVVIGPQQDIAGPWRQAVARHLAEGPPPLTPEALDALRYEITDALDDLRGERPANELLAIGAMLHARLAELALRGRRRWHGTGKWAPRLLEQVDQGLAGQFDEAFRGLFRTGDIEAVVALVEQELAPHGGRLFEGDCRVAPGEWRLPDDGNQSTNTRAK